jgi:oligoendopeptidase F
LATQQVTWNLTELFPNITSPKIEEAIQQATAAADSFEQKYRGKIGNLTAQELQQCFKEVEAFDQKFSDVTLYSSLSFAANMTLPETQALNDKINKLEAKIAKQLAFYSLELGKLVKAKPQLINDQILANYPPKAMVAPS